MIKTMQPASLTTECAVPGELINLNAGPKRLPGYAFWIVGKGEQIRQDEQLSVRPFVGR